MYDVYKKKVIVLVGDYDAPYINALHNEDMNDFVCKFFKCLDKSANYTIFILTNFIKN